MNDYQPVNLSFWCNVDLDWVKKTRQVPLPDWNQDPGNFPLGHQLFRGLPFLIGKNHGENALLGFGPTGYQESVSIPIHRQAEWIIFAHTLLETKIFDGEPIGRVIAEYSFHLSGGTIETVPIRERFEISSLPVHWGQMPFIAVSDTANILPLRYAGNWDEIGFRMMEVDFAFPHWFVLWAWRNDHPKSVIESVTINPFDRSFILGAMTISSLEEDPFGRLPRTPAIMTFAEDQANEQDADVHVKVDRGFATYPHPLPSENQDKYLEDHFKGWGQKREENPKKFYVEIEATPSATVEVFRGEQQELSVNWQELTQNREYSSPGKKIELVNPEKNWVHVEVFDEMTGLPVHCRVSFRSAEGIPYQPHGHHNHLISDILNFNHDIGGDLQLGQMTYAYIDGKCQGWLPCGDVQVDISRGFEYQPIRTTVNIKPGQKSLRLGLNRIYDMKARRWFSGDTHVHFLSTMGALLEGSGEDLSVVNLLTAQWGHHFSNIEDFIGQPVTLPGKDTIVYTSQENRQHILGHLTMLGLKSPVMPWSSGGPDEAEPGGSLESTLSNWADACHQQGGTVVIPHFPTPNCENAALIATGRADAVEMCWHEMYVHQEYYRYLNGGYRLPLVGGTDKMSIEVPVGINRTYVSIPENEPLTYENWCKYLRMGRTFISTGPMIDFSVDGAQIGDTIKVNEKGGTVHVSAEARSIFPIHTLEIINAGHVVASVEEVNGATFLQLETQIPIDSHTWLAARVAGPGYKNVIRHHDFNHRGVMAHTSPIYISVGENWRMFNQETNDHILSLLHGGLEHIHSRSHQHIPGTVTHHHEHHNHMAYLTKPFLDAIEIVMARALNHK